MCTEEGGKTHEKEELAKTALMCSGVFPSKGQDVGGVCAGETIPVIKGIRNETIWRGTGGVLGGREGRRGGREKGPNADSSRGISGRRMLIVIQSMK